MNDLTATGTDSGFDLDPDRAFQFFDKALEAFLGYKQMEYDAGSYQPVNHAPGYPAPANQSGELSNRQLLVLAVVGFGIYKLLES